MSNETNTEHIERETDMDGSCNCGILHIFMCCFRRRLRNRRHQYYQGQSINMRDCNTHRHLEADGTIRVMSIHNSPHQPVSYPR